MKIEQNIIFTNEDFELLSKVLPDNPCCKCNENIRGYCYGCQQSVDYDKLVKPYKDNNIYEIALDIKEFYNLDKSIKEIRSKQKDILDNLPKDVKYLILHR